MGGMGGGNIHANGDTSSLFLSVSHSVFVHTIVHYVGQCVCDCVFVRSVGHCAGQCVSHSAYSQFRVLQVIMSDLESPAGEGCRLEL